MRRTRTTLGAVVILILAGLGASPALAQANDDTLYTTAFAAYTEFGSRLGVESELGFGAALGGQFNDYIGLEGAFLRTSNADFTLVDNASTSYRAFRVGPLFHFNRPADWFLPYVAVGVSWQDFTRGAALRVDTLRRQAENRGREELRYSAKAVDYENGWGINWGLGAHFFLSDRISLRLDLRWNTAIGGDDFNNFEPYLGVSFWTGGPS